MTIEGPNCTKTLRHGSVSISFSPAARSCAGPRPVGCPVSCLTGPCLPRAEEAEHPLDQQGGGVPVVGRQRAVGEIVLIAGIEEQFPVLGLLHKLPRSVDIALADEDRISVHPMHLP